MQSCRCLRGGGGIQAIPALRAPLKLTLYASGALMLRWTLWPAPRPARQKETSRQGRSHGALQAPLVIASWHTVPLVLHSSADACSRADWTRA